MVLCGIAVAALFSAFISITKYLADPYDKLPAIVYWLMGSLSNTSLDDLYLVSIPMIIGFSLLLIIRWRINILAMGDEEAKSLGIDVSKLRMIIIICCTLLTAAAVSISKLLVVDWLFPCNSNNSWTDYKNYYLLLYVQGFFSSLVDDVARNLSQMEIPLNINCPDRAPSSYIFLEKEMRVGHEKSCQSS